MTVTSPLVPSPAAELVLGFVNTRALRGGRERLDDAASFREWLTEAGLAGAGAQVTPDDLASARELREALIGVLLSHAGEPVREADEACLRRFGRLHPVLPLVGAGGAALEPAEDGVAGAFGRILGAAAELALLGTWSRVKACRNPPCRLGYYDRSRNLAAAYCEARTCGAQVAARAYRARRAGAAG
ncbi:putative RNA-binding Zn ribbon-like protein [Thermocatellispora tengchongensis]|uniref:Putative RNA-binding Zn ribbon-like protein n=1 Tax=Thermocatellispora tengchongensis TaxID=1073253 RepID=A0A840NVT1_9ACTN|nr:CGNR zinc finger domain-containing protein [Thermocatellispora tengchongensis]MBB5131638.1 putative RNA-binding Zn ribbon-like protein [Thermocatellispora tengchongensis]